MRATGALAALAAIQAGWLLEVACAASGHADAQPLVPAPMRDVEPEYRGQPSNCNGLVFVYVSTSSECLGGTPSGPTMAKMPADTGEDFNVCAFGSVDLDGGFVLFSDLHTANQEWLSICPLGGDVCLESSEATVAPAVDEGPGITGARIETWDRHLTGETYTLLDFDETCAGQGYEEVSDQTTCFGAAKNSIEASGQTVSATVPVSQSFSCGLANGALFWGGGAAGAAAEDMRYVCQGEQQSSTTRTTSSATSTMTTRTLVYDPTAVSYPDKCQLYFFHIVSAPTRTERSELCDEAANTMLTLPQNRSIANLLNATETAELGACYFKYGGALKAFYDIDLQFAYERWLNTCAALTTSTESSTVSSTTTATGTSSSTRTTTTRTSTTTASSSTTRTTTTESSSTSVSTTTESSSTTVSTSTETSSTTVSTTTDSSSTTGTTTTETSSTTASATTSTETSSTTGTTTTRTSTTSMSTITDTSTATTTTVSTTTRSSSTTGTTTTRSSITTVSTTTDSSSTTKSTTTGTSSTTVTTTTGTSSSSSTTTVSTSTETSSTTVSSSTSVSSITLTSTTGSSTTTSATTTSATTRSATTTTPTQYVVLEAGMTCTEAGYDEVDSAAECFNNATDYLGPNFTSELVNQLIVNQDFACVVQYGVLFFGNGNPGTASADKKFVCKGEQAPTSTSTETTSSMSRTTTTLRFDPYAVSVPDLCQTWYFHIVNSSGLNVSAGINYRQTACFTAAQTMTTVQPQRVISLEPVTDLGGCVFSSGGDTITFYDEEPVKAYSEWLDICEGLTTSTASSTSGSSSTTGTTVTTTATSSTTVSTTTGTSSTTWTTTTGSSSTTVSTTTDSSSTTRSTTTATSSTTVSTTTGTSSTTWTTTTGSSSTTVSTTTDSSSTTRSTTTGTSSTTVTTTTGTSSLTMTTTTGTSSTTGTTSTETSSTTVSTTTFSTMTVSSTTESSSTTGTTTTETSSSTASTTTGSSSTTITESSTTSMTTTTPTNYVVLPAGQTCAEAGYHPIPDSTGCFDNATRYLGLDPSPVLDSSANFACVLKFGGTVIFFGNGTKDTASSSWENVCQGEQQTSSTTTATTSSTSATTTSLRYDPRNVLFPDVCQMWFYYVVNGSSIADRRAQCSYVADTMTSIKRYNMSSTTSATGPNYVDLSETDRDKCDVDDSEWGLAGCIFQLGGESINYQDSDLSTCSTQTNQFQTIATRSMYEEWLDICDGLTTSTASSTSATVTSTTTLTTSVTSSTTASETSSMTSSTISGTSSTTATTSSETSSTTKTTTTGTTTTRTTTSATSSTTGTTTTETSSTTGTTTTETSSTTASTTTESSSTTVSTTTESSSTTVSTFTETSTTTVSTTTDSSSTTGTTTTETSSTTKTTTTATSSTTKTTTTETSSTTKTTTTGTSSTTGTTTTETSSTTETSTPLCLRLPGARQPLRAHPGPPRPRSIPLQPQVLVPSQAPQPRPRPSPRPLLQSAGPRSGAPSGFLSPTTSPLWK
ncbi:unnamed protein product [Prorocentrum cordatum]|uniref:Uncharacterized protein n=1 Tax=Prorocentrum cordatum TaxID=2364126 RepID=A0ABN9SXP1_9DINO|nr:unnamed protein product [Polarella glacialis]